MTRLLATKLDRVLTSEWKFSLQKLNIEIQLTKA